MKKGIGFTKVIKLTKKKHQKSIKKTGWRQLSWYEPEKHGHQKRIENQGSKMVRNDLD